MCFFFQAEDGIRDYKVTGVQTCALPISSMRCSSTPSAAKIDAYSQPMTPAPTTARVFGKLGRACVGIECRSRWERCQEKKKKKNTREKKVRSERASMNQGPRKMKTEIDQ